MSRKIAVIVGSLRKDSWNKKLALALIKHAPNQLNLEIVEIGNLPLYNEDLDTPENTPQAYIDFRNKLKEVDGVIFVTPEYNRSMPGVLKNAIDVGSRPYGSSIWEKKAAAIISSSPGAIGGFGSNQHLRQTFVFLNIICMQQPEAYIGHVDKLFNQDGSLAKEETTKFLEKFMQSYASWVELVHK